MMSTQPLLPSYASATRRIDTSTVSVIQTWTFTIITIAAVVSTIWASKGDGIIWVSCNDSLFHRYWF